MKVRQVLPFASPGPPRMGSSPGTSRPAQGRLLREPSVPPAESSAGSERRRPARAGGGTGAAGAWRRRRRRRSGEGGWGGRGSKREGGMHRGGWGGAGGSSVRRSVSQSVRAPLPARWGPQPAAPASDRNRDWSPLRRRASPLPRALPTGPPARSPPGAARGRPSPPAGPGARRLTRCARSVPPLPPLASRAVSGSLPLRSHL